MRPILLALLLLPTAAAAQDHAALARAAYEQHILPGFTAFEAAATHLATTAPEHCAPTDPDLRAAYNQAFDAWLGVQHIAFGPLEQDDRAYALAFWPDTKGRTPAGLNSLLQSTPPADMANQSIAVRGFFALDYLLYDPEARADTPNGCALITAITADIARIAGATLADWSGPYGTAFTSAGTPGNSLYRAADEPTATLYTALVSSLDFNADQRLGRPMGTFDAPTPLRAEARRSGRPERNLEQSLTALSGLAAILATAVSPEAAQSVAAKTTRAITLAQKLDDPTFANTTPSGRLHLEQNQQAIDAITTALAQYVGAPMGIAQGFNAADGDGG